MFGYGVRNARQLPNLEVLREATDHHVCRLLCRPMLQALFANCESAMDRSRPHKMAVCGIVGEPGTRKSHPAFKVFEPILLCSERKPTVGCSNRRGWPAESGSEIRYCLYTG